MPILPPGLVAVLVATPIIKYGVIFLLVIIEGPIITMGAGMLFALGYINPIIAYTVIVFGDLFSDSLYYAVGYFGREKTLKKFEKFFGGGWPALNKLEEILRKRAGLVLIGGKLTHLAGVPVLLAAGAAKINFRKFLIYDTIATTPKSLLFLVIGYYFGKFTDVINKYLEYGTFLTLALGVLLVVGYIMLGKKLGKNILS